MRRRPVTIFLLLVLAGLVGWSLWSRFGRREAAAEPVAAPVAVQSPSRGPISRTLRYAGTLEPRAIVTVLSKVPGRVERILVSEGDTVTKGQLLVLMEDDVAHLQADQASASLEAARAQLEKAQRGVRPEELASAQATLAAAEKDLADADTAFQRAERLYADGAITKAAREDAEGKLRTARTGVDNARRSVQMMEQGAGSEEQRMAEAQLASAQAQYDLAKLNLDNTRVTAPIGGQVAKVPIDEGNIAGMATALVVIVNETAMVVKAALPERHYGDFLVAGENVRAEAVFAALAGRGALPGRLISISPTIDPATRTFTAEVEVTDPKGELRSGMYASVTFEVERADDALLVPTAALCSRGGGRGVFVVDGGVARFRALKTGIEGDGMVQVLEGLAAGDRVVVDGNAFLENGQRVSLGE
ncbi:MAG: efflux RND transporter periplasmic adaptor subunit [Spirochaetes bacterium]|nr:efflux RND transporter periplasmic adaptor subunit [Spirochaetota bacterium]